MKLSYFHVAGDVPYDIKSQTAVVIDVLRATTTIACALNNGAEAVQTLFPDTQVTIGPVIENGFYYDFEKDKPFTLEDLVVIEKKMHEQFYMSQLSLIKN